ncbi:hypothetical protein C5167_021235 [Papaver somniferum]|uniref:Knottin scorpion toxin-like domain-containing protein n=1 Tax=Papaver somniferum TaxID=3469 RepID=A0A4Y7IYN6_PAPSO|nr:hypothetical protein C5167_021235 [Papaver somniferum]
MASLKRFSLTYVVIALIFGVILASSLANAGRTIDGELQQDIAGTFKCRGTAHICNGSGDCATKCSQLGFRQAICTPLKSYFFGDKYCCCY